MPPTKIKISEKKKKKVIVPRSEGKNKLLIATTMIMVASVILMAFGYLIPYSKTASTGQTEYVGVNPNEYSLVKLQSYYNNTATLKFSMPHNGSVHYIFYRLIKVYTMIGLPTERFSYLFAGNASDGSTVNFMSNNSLGYAVSLKSVNGGEFQVQVSTAWTIVNPYPFNPFLSIPGFVLFVVDFSIMVTFIGDKEGEEW